MFEILDMVHGILEEQKITAEEQLQLNKICDLEDKFVKGFSKEKWKEYFTQIFDDNGYKYTNNPNFSESLFNEIEKNNIELIKIIENTKEPILLSEYLK